MNKKLLALAAVAAMGISMVGATPQTTFTKGQTQIDLGASNVENKTAGVSSDKKWNFDGGVTYALGDKTALQYNYQGLNVKNGDSDNRMHEVNVVQSLGKNVAAYAVWANISGDHFAHDNNISQVGLVAKAPIGHKLEAYAKGAVGTKDTSLWEAGLGYKVTHDLDLKAGYKQINTRLTDDHSTTFKGFTTGLSYRFGGHSDVAEPVVTPVTPAPVVDPTAPTVKKADYYTTSIYFDSDVDTPRADQAPNLAAALNAANQYPNDRVKLVGNADSSYNAAYNQGLSERRVQSVAQYLVNNGVDANRLVGLANGDKKPVDSNATSAGRAENRRVDVFVNR